MQSYDHFYAEKLHKAKYDIDDERTETLFPIRQSGKSGFGFGKKLFWVKFVEINDVQNTIQM